MKKVRILLVVTISALLLNACGFLECPNVTNQKSIDKFFPKVLEKHLDGQTVVTELVLSTTSDFSFDMDIVTVEGFVPNSETLQSFAFSLPGNNKPREREKNNLDHLTSKDGIKLSEIDFSQITFNVNKAIQMLKDEGHEANGLAFYQLSFTGNPKETIATFYLRSKGGTNFGTQNGRAALVTEYTEFQFQADSDGNITILE
jgi:hypothetical protein